MKGEDIVDILPLPCGCVAFIFSSGSQTQNVIILTHTVEAIKASELWQINYLFKGHEQQATRSLKWMFINITLALNRIYHLPFTIWRILLGP